jgi:TolB-like protein/DNA-binding winged helix-turn-helix (wHTH) protein/Tfp pilus assembly protein PilF
LRYLFEDYTFDTERRELHRGADAVSITPQVFDLLEYLIRNRERVVSKDDLIGTVWNGRIVSNAALTTRLNAVRNAIGDSGEKQCLIKTLPRKGFRFVGTVQEAPMGVIAAVVGGSGDQSDAVPGRAVVRHGPDVSMLNRPSSPPLSIVVLPFTNLSADPEQDYFVDGVTESLTTDLSRISGSFIIGRHTAFTYKGKPVDLKQLGRELNVRYALEGSVQRSGDRLRVNVQLVDAETGAHLWADRFDKPVADVFDMQDKIVSRLANQLEAQLTEEEARRSKGALNLNSMEMYFQGQAFLNRGWLPEHLAQALALFERALTLDSQNVEAMLGIAQVDMICGAAFNADNQAALLADAETMVSKALGLAPNNALAHLYRGNVLINTNRMPQGMAECERALVLDRNLADAHAQIGTAKYFLGRGAETEAHIEEALRFSPRDTRVYRWLARVGFAKLQLAADGEAVDWFSRSIEANGNYPLGHFGLAAALALVGSLNQARASVQVGLAVNPNFTLRRLRNGTTSDNPIFLAKRERLYQGLRLAGLPER